MRTYESFDLVPVDEPSPSIGEENYRQTAREAGNRYIQMLTKRFPGMPNGCEFKIKSNPHDFGTYYEVALYYDDENEEEAKFFFHVEANPPYTWNDDEVVPFKPYP